MMLYLASKEWNVYDYIVSKALDDICPATRLISDIKALKFLLEGTDSTRIPCHANKARWVYYGIGDASGDGFGAAIHIVNRLKFRYGQRSSGGLQTVVSFEILWILWKNCVKVEVYEGVNCFYSHTIW